MTVQSAGMLFTGSAAVTYRGADRRGIIARLANPATSRLVAWTVAGVIAVPLAGVAVLSVTSGLPVAAASVGAADAALVAFLATAVVLLLRWRLVGEAASVPLAAVALTAGLLFVPATHQGGPVPGYVAALQTTSVIVMLVGCLGALALPEVCAGLRPTVVIVSAVGGALVMAIPLAIPPVVIGAPRGADGFVVASAIEGLGCAVVAIALLARGIRSRHVLFAAAGAALLSIAAGCAALSSSPLAPTGPWAALPSFFLLVGAAAFLLVAGTDLRSAFSAIVLHDVRGRRRWVAAETELAQVRSAHRGQSHDVTSMLSAVDGTLLALSAQRDRLSPEKSTQLLAAVRGQIQRLTTVLAEDQASARSYDLSELLAGIVALHASRSQPVRFTTEPALEVPGHPDRVMRIVNNLLVNAARYAPAASVTLTARRVPHPSDGEMAELIVADNGPGLTDAELEQAFEPGWRGDAASGVSGSGLGLSQCRDLAEAEGGEIVLGPTHPSGAPGARGLTARVHIPVHRAAPSAPRSSILQMRLGQEGAINEDAVPGPASTAVA
jgi:signal transduction histidine kinase